jgi:hypothetical protein
MNAEMITDWAARKGFSQTGAKTLKKRTDTAEIRIEIKRSSVVMIWQYMNNQPPRILTSLFKDIPVDEDSGELFPAGIGRGV